MDTLTTLGDWLFKGWESIGRVLVVGTLAYAGLLLFLRISGKRTLSKMNAFDLVVTVALGSTLATILMSRQTGLVDGLMGFATLIGLQFLVARLSVGWAGFRRLIKSEPSLLFFGGRFLEQAMHRQRVVEGEVLAAFVRPASANWPTCRRSCWKPMVRLRSSKPVPRRVRRAWISSRRATGGAYSERFRF